MADADALAEGLNAEYDSIRTARERIEQSDVAPEVRARLLAELAQREAQHAARVAEYDAVTTLPVGREPGLVQAREAQREQAAQASTVASRMRAKLPEGDPRAEAAAEQAVRMSGELAPSDTPMERVSYNATPLPPNTPEDDLAAIRREEQRLAQLQGTLSQLEGVGATIVEGVGGRQVGAVRQQAIQRHREEIDRLQRELEIRRQRFAEQNPVTSVSDPGADGVDVVVGREVGSPLAGASPTPSEAASATPPAGTPTTAPTGAPRGTGGGRARPQTASIAEQLLAALQNGDPAQDELLQRLVDSYRREATTRGDFGEQAGIVVSEAMAQEEELARARAEEWQQELVAQERRLQEIDTALGVLSSTRFDANRLFTDRGLATSMALGVAVNAATSLAQNALFPGANAGNTALQIVNGAIERDIQTQVVNYERGVQSVQGMRTAYEMARNLSGDRHAAYEFAMATSQRRVGEQLRSMAMQTQGLVAREQLMRQADDLLLQAAQREELARMQMAQAMMAARPRGTGGGGGRLQSQLFAPFIRISPEAQRAGIRTPADVLKALGSAGADRLRNFAAASSDAIDLIDRIVRTMESYSTFSMVDRATMENLIVNLQGILKDQMEFGALDAGVERTLNRMLGNPNSFTETRAEFLARMRNQRAVTMSRIRRRVEALGGGIAVYDVTAGMTAPQNEEPGITIVGETRDREVSLLDPVTAEGGARILRRGREIVGDTAARAILGDATIEAIAGGE